MSLFLFLFFFLSSQLHCTVSKSKISSLYGVLLPEGVVLTRVWMSSTLSINPFLNFHIEKYIYSSSFPNLGLSSLLLRVVKGIKPPLNSYSFYTLPCILTSIEMVLISLSLFFLLPLKHSTSAQLLRAGVINPSSRWYSRKQRNFQSLVFIYQLALFCNLLNRPNHSRIEERKIYFHFS